MRWLCRMAAHGAAGFILLFLFNFLGGHFGLSIGLNPLNALIIGALGVPGFALLLILHLL
ncbi:MAG: pro-sigmaK processing inhibitor BofA family protein [Oscillospiraceae bacterium]|nr:pro-sigmaK processing inhibitor BofA family protein [Oscillospiraceae bacterium]